MYTQHTAQYGSHTYSDIRASVQRKDGERYLQKLFAYLTIFAFKPFANVNMVVNIRFAILFSINDIN